MGWISYKYKWATSVYQVSLPTLVAGNALCAELGKKPDIEFVWLDTEPRYYNKKG